MIGRHFAGNVGGMDSESTATLRRPLAAILILLAACAQAPPANESRTRTAPAGPAVRVPIGETWYSISDGSQRYGSVHEAVQRLADGGAEFRVETTMRIELFGKQQEHSAVSRVVVDHDLRLVQFETTSTQASGRRVYKGEATGSGIAVTTEQDGSTSHTVHAPADAAELICDAVLAAWLHARTGSDGTAPHHLRILSTQDGSVAAVSVRRRTDDRAGSTWEMLVDGAFAPSILHLDGEGRLAEQVDRFPPVRMSLCTRAEAADFTHRRIPDRELLVFTPGQALPPAHRLERVTVELTWEHIAPEEFHLTDSRQRLISLVAEGSRCVAKVELARPGELACRFSLARGADRWDPADRAALAAALAEDDFIKPEDPQIAAMAREIVGTETSALAASRSICRWVSENVVPSMIAETLTGPEVLAKRTGKCTECTTLFASLARAAGIPTRVALGQRRFASESGDSWGGHMWNEVFVGEWIPVDASANEVGGSTSLLKFVHSDTVAGTQPLRWKLTESLGLAIAEHTLLERPASGGAVATGLAGRTWTDAEHAFRIDLPGDDWRVKATEQGNVTTLRIRAPKGPADSALFHLVVFPMDGEVAPRTIIAARLEQHRDAMDGFQLVLDEPHDVAGARGHRIRFEGATKGDAVKRRVTEVVWIHEGQGFLINLIASEEAHDAQAANFAQIVASFAFLAK